MDLHRHRTYRATRRTYRYSPALHARRRYRFAPRFSLHRLLLPTLLIGGSAGALFFFYILVTLPDPTVIVQRQVVQSTKILDRTGGTILYDIHDEFKRTAIALEDVPAFVKHATIVAEDKDFYRHQGFDLKGIARAIIKNIFSLSKAQGGSTITQQLVKNALLTNQKTFTRKARELLLAYEIERRFSKDQILKMYLNEIPYGRQAYGIEAASQTYFNKSARDLTLAEGAALAALPKAPSYYSPYGSRKEELLGRQRHILSQLAQQGYVSADQEKQAKAEPLRFANPKETIIAPHFVFYIRELIEKEFGSAAIEQGGLTVTTTLDVAKQRLAEEAITHGEEKLKSYNATNAALVSVDVKTGQILAMVGSRDFFNDDIDGKVNVATRPRQPGSSFKPVVYAASFEKGYTPDTLLYDVATTFKNIPKDYTPSNYNGKTYGPVTVRKALAGSLNIPAVKMLYLTGVDRVLDLAGRMGYTTLGDRSRFSLSLVLGGGEVTLLEHTAAFGAFAGDGTMRPSSAILKVEDSNGAVLKEFEDHPRQVFEAQIARQVNDILSDNNSRAFIFGATNRLTLPERPAAAKTGTTNDNHDAWLIGYTPSLVTGIWVGNNNNKEMKKGADGSVVAAPIWNEYMVKALEGTSVESFTPPIVTMPEKPVLRAEREGAMKVRVDRASGKLATDRTPPSFVEERTYAPLHSILHWVDKDNPQGAAPAEPWQDPQYENWEQGVKEWARAQNPPVEGTSPPTQSDDVHIPENVPTVDVAGITAGAVLGNPQLALTVRADSPRGVRTLQALVDGVLVSTLFDQADLPSPATLNVNLDAGQEIQNGNHTLSIVALDDVDNSATVNIPFSFNR